MANTNNNRLPSNLPQLQNLIKRDRASYFEEFERQYSVYEATRAIFELNPADYHGNLYELAMFFAQVAQCYPDYLKDFPQDLVGLLQRHSSVLHPDLRLGLVKALVLLRNKNLLAPTDLLVLFFKLLRCQDKVLRKFLQDHIITDIKNINSKSKNMKLNRELQNFMQKMLRDNHAVAAKTALDVMMELYKKQIWNDTKTVNIIAGACFSKITKIAVAAMKFFVGREDDEAESDSEESENEGPNLRQTLMAVRVNKKSKKKQQRKVELVKATLKKNKSKKKKRGSFDFSALQLIHDPQEMAERLYKKLDKMNERFEVKLMTMNLISRLIGIHSLYLPNFYALVQRFLFPHQREVTKVMVYAAQAAHALVPPDDLAPVVRTLADNFVTERHAHEVMAMGLNAIRQLCSRNHYCMSEDLLQDLAQYKSHKDKGVTMAARSLIALFREKNSELLARKDRGAPTELSTEMGMRQFGESEARDYIPGAEVLSFKTAEEGEEKPEYEESDGSNESEEDWTDEESEEDEKEEKYEDPALEDGEEKILSNKEAIQEVMKLAPGERAALAAEVVTSRFLTDADFAKIDATQAAKNSEKYSKSKKRKRAEEKEENCGEFVTLKSIEMVYKKKRHDKDTRMQSVQEGREGRSKFGVAKGRMNPNASTTNKEKKRTKAFMMVKHKIKGKQKKSFRDKQVKLRNALLKQKRTIMK